jgi:hypothetical protein
LQGRASGDGDRANRRYDLRRAKTGYIAASSAPPIATDFPQNFAGISVPGGRCNDRGRRNFDCPNCGMCVDGRCARDRCVRGEEWRVATAEATAQHDHERAADHIILAFSIAEAPRLLHEQQRDRALVLRSRAHTAGAALMPTGLIRWVFLLPLPGSVSCCLSNSGFLGAAGRTNLAAHRCSNLLSRSSGISAISSLSPGPFRQH